MGSSSSIKADMGSSSRADTDSRVDMGARTLMLVMLGTRTQGSMVSQ